MINKPNRTELTTYISIEQVHYALIHKCLTEYFSHVRYVSACKRKVKTIKTTSILIIIDFHEEITKNIDWHETIEGPGHIGISKNTTRFLYAASFISVFEFPKRNTLVAIENLLGRKRSKSFLFGQALRINFLIYLISQRH